MNAVKNDVRFVKQKKKLSIKFHQIKYAVD